MKLTLSVIKADIGSIGGHVAPSKRLTEAVEEVIRKGAPGLILDHYISHTGDDIAILMTHRRGEGD
jgi:fructose 1,6-bisphosphate aldolase/phosphatase